METTIRNSVPARSQLLFGLQAPLSTPGRPKPGDRVDVPEIQESTRVHFSQGAAVQSLAATRSGIDLYRVVQKL